MGNAANYRKVAVDMSWAQLKWSVWFMSIVFIVFLFLQFVAGDVEIDQHSLGQASFLDFAYQPSRIFMLVIGIISVSGFLTFYVKQGVTRKNYFYGAVISAGVLSLALMLAASLLSVVEHFIAPAEGAAFVQPENPWILTVIVYTLNILVYFAVGWMIGAGFYRNGLIGFLYIPLALVSVFIIDILWKRDLRSIFQVYQEWGFPYVVSFAGTLLLLAFVLWVVRMTTKSVRIKLK